MTINIGLPMIGSYTNMVIYTLELVEAYIYYFASPRSVKDPIFLKCCVATSLVSDTVGTFGVCGLIFVTVLGSLTARRLYWGFQMYIVSNTTSSFIFQIFMLYRYWTLSRNYVVSGLIALLILVSLGTNFSLIAHNLAIVSRELFRSSKIHVHEQGILVVLACAMLTDVSITTALLWELNRPGAHGRLNLQTRRLIRKVSSQAIRTGVVPCVFALITLVSYLAYKNQNIATCFAYVLGRVYTSTMLFALIYRDKLQPGGQWVDRTASASRIPAAQEHPQST